MTKVNATSKQMMPVIKEHPQRLALLCALVIIATVGVLLNQYLNPAHQFFTSTAGIGTLSGLGVIGALSLAYIFWPLFKAAPQGKTALAGQRAVPPQTPVQTKINRSIPREPVPSTETQTRAPVATLQVDTVPVPAQSARDYLKANHFSFHAWNVTIQGKTGEGWISALPIGNYSQEQLAHLKMLGIEYDVINVAGLNYYRLVIDGTSETLLKTCVEQERQSKSISNWLSKNGYRHSGEKIWSKAIEIPSTVTQEEIERVQEEDGNEKSPFTNPQFKALKQQVIDATPSNLRFLFCAIYWRKNTPSTIDVVFEIPQDRLMDPVVMRLSASAAAK